MNHFHFAHGERDGVPFMNSMGSRMKMREFLSSFILFCTMEDHVVKVLLLPRSDLIFRSAEVKDFLV